MRYLVALLTFVLAGCATSESGSDAVLIETVSQGQPVTGASCAVTTSSGSWNVTTPETVDLAPVQGDVKIVCEKSGYRTSELAYRMPAGYGRPGMGLGVGGGSGGVGVGFGLSFPIGRRAAHYPSNFVVEMNPL